ncbi:MAG: cation transporter [Acidobacteria bacterium]|nr:cation transporter [Acidobacteriota bacterium]
MNGPVPRGPAVVAVVTALVLASSKLVVGLLTGSLAVIAAAADNLLDVACSGLNVFFLGVARKPPDEEHPFGHGKAEALSGVIQATIIATGGLVLLGRSIWELGVGGEIHATLPGLIVAGASLVISLLLGLYLRFQARRYRSVALKADAFHYLTDVFTNGTAIAALMAVRLTGQHWWDPIGSLVISVYIVWQSVDILREGADELLDRGLPKELEAEVARTVHELGPEVRGYRRLRTRRAGKTLFIELRLHLDREVSFERSHELTEELIGRLRARFGEGTEVMVDTDPA